MGEEWREGKGVEEEERMKGKRGGGRVRRKGKSGGEKGDAEEGMGNRAG